MKNLIKTVLVCALLLSAHLNAAWISSEERQRIKETAEALQRQQRQTSDWQTVSALLGVACVAVFVTGTAIGSRVRRKAKEVEQQ